MYDYKLQCGGKHFYYYCLYVFSKKDIWKFFINDCLKMNGKQKIKMSKKVNKLDSKVLREQYKIWGY